MGFAKFPKALFCITTPDGYFSDQHNRAIAMEEVPKAPPVPIAASQWAKLGTSSFGLPT